MPWASVIWRTQLRPVESQGYIIPAWNVGSVDYVDCARSLAKTILMQHPKARICLLTNEPYAAEPALFAYTHVVEDINTDNPWANDWMVFSKTPFRETIKLEADMVIATPIDHWWDLFRHRDVVVSTGCRSWQGHVSTARNYRQCFDANHLPDVYNAITYWRLSPTAKEFFDLVRDIFVNWIEFRKLIRFPEEVPSTDLVYAMAAEIMGRERVTLPFVTYPQIVHMKRHHAGTETEDWMHELTWEGDPYRINTVAQWGAVHYRAKR
jgi:hypothetical protein